MQPLLPVAAPQEGPGAIGDFLWGWDHHFTPRRALQASMVRHLKDALGNWGAKLGLTGGKLVCLGWGWWAPGAFCAVGRERSCRTPGKCHTHDEIPGKFHFPALGNERRGVKRVLDFPATQ